MTHMESRENPRTILALSPLEAERWCLHVSVGLHALWVRETLFADTLTTQAAQSVQELTRDGRRTADPHLRRARELRDGECLLTRELMGFVGNMDKQLRGERASLFEDEAMTKDDARSWLAEKRTQLKRKIQRERRYRKACPYPDTNAATAQESEMQQDVLLLLDELLRSYPPLKLPRTKNGSLS